MAILQACPSQEARNGLRRLLRLFHHHPVNRRPGQTERARESGQVRAVRVPLYGGRGNDEDCLGFAAVELDPEIGEVLALLDVYSPNLV